MGQVISSYLLGGFPPEFQISPEKHPKYKKNHIKNASNLPPRYVFPQNLESRINLYMGPYTTSHIFSGQTGYT